MWYLSCLSFAGHVPYVEDIHFESATFNPLKEVMIHHLNIHVMPWLTHELVIQWWSPTYTKCNRRLGTQKNYKTVRGTAIPLPTS